MTDVMVAEARRRDSIPLSDLWREELWIAGRWRAAAAVDAHASARVGVGEVIDPATNRLLGRVPVAAAIDVDDAVAAAGAAQSLWASRDPAERVHLVTAIAAGIREQAGRLAAIVSAEMGAPIDNARETQVLLAADVFASFAEVATSFRWERRVGHSLVVHEPVGVVAAITPWNYPLYQIATKLAAALVAGCAVVLKPSGEAPLSSFVLMEIVAQACRRTAAPLGLVNLVCGPGATVGEHLAGHPGVDAVSFTGSTVAGRRVGAIAAQSVKRVSLELGGKSAAVLLDDLDDLRPALSAALSSVFYNTGQTCTACSRILVPADRRDEAADIAAGLARSWRLGDPAEPGGHLGPLATRGGLDRVRSHLAGGLAAGARLLAGGEPDPGEIPADCEGGNWILPTVLTDVPVDSPLRRDEIFGPVAVVIGYRDRDDACRIANDSIYGLAGAVWAADPAGAVRFARRMRTGRVDINGAAFNVLSPIGGYKQSGNGRELGEHGLREFLEVKGIQS